MSIEEQIINMPLIDSEHKIVQLELDGKAILLFPFNNEMSHCYILEGFLKRKDISYEMVKVRDFNIPSQLGERYKVVGAGRAKVNANGKLALFHDYSRDYNLEINKEHLYLVRSLMPEWEFELKDIYDERQFEARFGKK